MAESAPAAGVAATRRLLPPRAFLAALAVLGALHALLPLRDLGLPPALRGAGVLLAVAAVGHAVAARGRSERVGTGVVPFSPATQLVTDGPFRFSRNPMYLAMIGALGGVALAAGSLAVWVVPIVFGLWLRRAFVLPEEAFMAERFGEAYTQYRGRVRRWL